jgi:hypothetical protein
MHWLAVGVFAVKALFEVYLETIAQLVLSIFAIEIVYKAFIDSIWPLL